MHLLMQARVHAFKCIHADLGAAAESQVLLKSRGYVDDEQLSHSRGRNVQHGDLLSS